MDDYGDRAQFLAVYIREAHAADEWRMEHNDNAGVVVWQPSSIGERSIVAQQSAQALGITMPMVVDTMDDAVSLAYGGWPDRMYVIGADGRVLYQGKIGPWGFKPAEVAKVLAGLYAKPAAAAP